MTDALRLSFDADSDGTGELFAEVRGRHFSGLSSAWFDSAALVAFARRLAGTFPLNLAEPLVLEGGFWGSPGAGIDQLHLGLKFYPIGGLGVVGCRVTLATSVHTGERADSQASVALELTTHYEQLRSFARSLELLATGKTDEAVLEAEA